MSIISTDFLFLTAATLFLFYGGRSGRWRRGVLGAASAVFVLSFAMPDGARFSGIVDIAVLTPVAGFAVAGYVAILLARRSRSRIPLIAAGVVLAYGAGKYWLPARFGDEPALVTAGLSYILFRVLHIVLDEGAGVGPGSLSPGRYARYVLFFPAFSAGPIWRCQDFEAQMEGVSGAVLTEGVVRDSLSRIADGLVKVLFMAEFFLHEHVCNVSGFTELSENPQLMDFLFVQLNVGLYYSKAALFYLLYMYCDFSGYMDIVLGTGRLFGLKIPENFNAPLESADVLDFWNRWHITLSQWVQRYVFTPLIIFLARRFPEKRMTPFTGAAGYLVSFVIIGLWHDPGWRFLLFGLGLGLAASVTKAGGHYLKAYLGRKRYEEGRARLSRRALIRGVSLFAVAASLSAVWAEGDAAAGGLRFFTVVSAAAAGVLFAVPLGLLSAAVRKAAAFLAFSRDARPRDTALSGLLRAALSELWLAARLFAALHVFLTSAADMPEFIYQGF